MRYKSVQAEKLSYRSRAKSDGENKISPSAYLALSLFIVLLAFFIVLNGISGFDDLKVVPVIDSVSDVFGSKTRIDDRAPQRAAVHDHEQKTIYKGKFFDRIDALFTSQIVDFKIMRTDRLGIMRVQVRWDDFLKAVREKDQINALDRDEVRRLKTFFLPTLVAMLQDESQNNPIHMSILLNLDKNPAGMKNNEPQVLNEYIENVSEIANIFGDQGLNDNLMSVGFSSGPENIVNLFFSPHHVYYEREDFTGDDLENKDIVEDLDALPAEPSDAPDQDEGRIE